MAEAAAKPKTIEEYIALQEPQKQEALQKILEALKEVLPQAEETIAWGMPVLKIGHNIIGFSAMKNHIGIYPGTEAVEQFLPVLQDSVYKGYSAGKGCIRMPWKKANPDLAAEIARWCLETGHHI